LASQSDLTDGQAYFACRMLRKYRRQLGDEIMNTISK
jgi:hypothetical protein